MSRLVVPRLASVATPLSDARRAHLLECAATGRTPAPLRVGAVTRPVRVWAPASPAGGALVLPPVSRRALLKGGAALAAAPLAMGSSGCVGAVAITLFVTYTLVRAVVEVFEIIDGEFTVENPESQPVPQLDVTAGLLGVTGVADPSDLTIPELEEAYTQSMVGLIEVPAKAQIDLPFALEGSEVPGTYWVAGVLRGELLAEDIRFDSGEHLQVTTATT